MPAFGSSNTTLLTGAEAVTSSLGFAICLSTRNSKFFMAGRLPRAGMNMLNISVDTLRPERFEQMTRRRGHERVMDAIHLAIRLGYDPVKVYPNVAEELPCLHYPMI